MTKEEEIKLFFENFSKHLQKDGGDIRFTRIDEEKNVYVKLFDSCLNCSLKDNTLKILEFELKKIFPDINSIIEEN